VALVRILSLYGCFVKTSQSIRVGSKVVVNITYSGFHFTAKGRVVTQMHDGLGIEFIGIDPLNQERLEDCLAELAGNLSASATH
jgi:hypothetical protein